MPVLIATEHYCTIDWLGFVASREASLQAAPVQEMALSFAGYGVEDHAGLTRAACSRVKTQYPVGTEIRNTRQVSIVSAEELAATAEAMGIDHICPSWVGASIVVSGLADFSHIPPSSRLQGENGATLTVDMLNQSCVWPGKEIETVHPGKGAAYKPAAHNRRGVTAWVEREGVLAVGEKMRLHIPDQRAWAP